MKSKGTLVALVLFFAGVGVLMFIKVPPDREIRAQALKYVVEKLTASGMKEGADFSIGNVEIVSLDEKRALVEVEIRPAGQVAYLEVLPSATGWSVTKDLWEDFHAYLKLESTMEAAQVRLWERLRQRYGAETKISMKNEQEKIRAPREVVREGDRIVGVVTVEFALQGDQSCRYVERFDYTDGAWVLQGMGQLMEGVRRN